MSFDVERLYSLLPAVYRIRDIEQAQQLKGLLTEAETEEFQSLQSQPTLTAEDARRLSELEDKRQRGPLKALLSVISEQSLVLEEDLAELYDNLFIETCAEWVVPYIGDLIGVRGISAFPGASFTERAMVANTMAYRRRKGTAAMLEQLARDVTDWNASVVEYFQLLATTQYMNHIRVDNLAVASLHSSAALETIGTPFDSVTRTADVRRIESLRGKYNIPNVGIFLWRLADYSVTNGQPYRFDARRYLFDPLGKDIQLYNHTEPEDEITHLAEPINVPMGISRRVLARSLTTYYRTDKPSILLSEKGPSAQTQLKPIDSARIKVCDLSDLTDANGDVVKDINGKTVWSHLPNDKIAIDPVLGRIALPPNEAPENLHVTYQYGFSTEIGGGEYDRGSSLSAEPPIKVPDPQANIQTALNEIKATGGVVEITNNDQFLGSLNLVAGTSEGKKLELRAANQHQPVIVLGPNEELVLGGGADSEIFLNGLLIGGGVVRVSSAPANKLRRLRLVHCTLAPGPIGEILVPGSNPPTVLPPQVPMPRLRIEGEGAVVEIDRCILGPIRAIAGAQVHITNSIIDASSTTAVAYSGLSEDDPGARLRIENSTVIGKIFTETMQLASNSIFLADLDEADTWPAPVRAERLQQGCVRFSFIPPGSLLPSPHRCQPATASDFLRVRPSFTSTRFGDAGYGQLSQSCVSEITRGADDQVEMGAFHSLYQPRREANLRAALKEYLRFGLEAGIFYAS
ncbi:MAG TPA: hypothetical protein VEW46_13535 [Pyrinomonadaceae bacterium]|nr:hypothetical protein [Pyrinomonadaceae bacterium]